VLGDAHVYANHVDPLKEQLKNHPRPFPVRTEHGALNAGCLALQSHAASIWMRPLPKIVRHFVHSIS